MILIIDNYDSFTFNLVDLVRRYDEVEIRRNDDIDIDEIKAINPDGLLISPGPGTPADSGICPEIVSKLGNKLPILGVCLGHQVIGEVFGAKVEHAEKPMHGKVSMIKHKNQSVFEGVENPLQVMRYHSLVLKEEDFPKDLEITAKSENGEIMGIKHKYHPIEGVQFHPESILSRSGQQMIQNWLNPFAAK